MLSAKLYILCLLFRSLGESVCKVEFNTPVITNEQINQLEELCNQYIREQRPMYPTYYELNDPAIDKVKCWSPMMTSLVVLSKWVDISYKVAINLSRLLISCKNWLFFFINFSLFHVGIRWIKLLLPLVCQEATVANATFSALLFSEHMQHFILCATCFVTGK